MLLSYEDWHEGDNMEKYKRLMEKQFLSEFNLLNILRSEPDYVKVLRYKTQNKLMGMII